MIDKRVKTQYLCFKLYFLKDGGEKYVEGQSRAEKDYTCRQLNNAIQHHTPGQEGQEKILQKESKGRVL